VYHIDSGGLRLTYGVSQRPGEQDDYCGGAKVRGSGCVTKDEKNPRLRAHQDNLVKEFRR
jgi:hypothetical protein